jgi:hypothetical protein
MKSDMLKKTMEVSPALNQMLDHLAVSNGTTVEDVILKGVALYRVASEAKQRNQHLSVVDAEQKVVTEIEDV